MSKSSGIGIFAGIPNRFFALKAGQPFVSVNDGYRRAIGVSLGDLHPLLSA